MLRHCRISRKLHGPTCGHGHGWAPFDIEIVASRIHDAFEANAGASPATLMKILYDEETEALGQGGQRLAALLDESMQREREVTGVAERLGETNVGLSARVNELEAEVQRYKAEQNEARRDRKEATLALMFPCLLRR